MFPIPLVTRPQLGASDYYIVSSNLLTGNAVPLLDLANGQNSAVMLNVPLSQ
jgi:hypothetical protein